MGHCNMASSSSYIINNNSSDLSYESEASIWTARITLPTVHIFSEILFVDQTALCIYYSTRPMNLESGVE